MLLTTDPRPTDYDNTVPTFSWHKIIPDFKYVFLHAVQRHIGIYENAFVHAWLLQSCAFSLQ